MNKRINPSKSADGRQHVVPMGEIKDIRPNLRRTIRNFILFSLNLYIVVHVTLWYGFDIQLWGKTAMTGVPALVRGNINISAIMVLIILLSVLVFGRGFCGWACHVRGLLEFSDWIMRKLNIKGYMALRRQNILITTRYSWLLRAGAFIVLLMPVTIFLLQNEYELSFAGMMSPSPWTDMPGDKAMLFTSEAPVNLALTGTVIDLFLILTLSLIIVFTATFFFNYFYGQVAFCRILCPYSFMLAIFTNLNPWQRKITRVAECTGCRDCSTNCPQGIDISRELHHYNGKIESRECVKCFTCVDTCKHGVLQDTSRPAVAQLKPRIEYDIHPWHNEYKHVQTIEPMGPVADFLTTILALCCGIVASRLGGFWFFVGSIIGFLVLRLITRYFIQRFQSNKAEYLK